MRRAVGLFVAVLTVFPLLSGCEQIPEGAKWLVNCRLIDGTGAQPVADAVIAIKDGKILCAGQKGKLTVPAGAETVDLKGATVLPGFINAHVHDAYVEGNVKAWLKGGVTTVRDEGPGNPDTFPAERDKLNKDPMNATIVSASPILTVPGGYGLNSFESPEQAKKAVDRYIDAGADLIKFSIEDFQNGKARVMPTFEEVKAVVDEAHARKRKASAHITWTKHLKWAVDIGLDDIAHMVVDPMSADTAKAVADKGIYWEPTLELWKGISAQYKLDWLDITEKNTALFVKSGGKIALGTDFAGYPMEFDRGFPITEARLMAQAGMTNMEIIVAGTKNAAHVCGLDAVLGTVEAGKKADLLAVTGDPLVSLDDLLNVVMVVHGGTVAVDNRK